MGRALLVAVLSLVVAAPSFALAQPGPGPGPGPRPGPGPGASHEGPGSRGPSPVDLVAQRRKMQELRAERLKHVLRDDKNADRLLDAIAKHDEKKNGYEDEKAKVLRQIEQIVQSLMNVKVTAVKGDEVKLGVGSDEKIAPGVAFVIRHGGAVAGRVVVEKTATDECLCKVVSRESGQKIEVDDPAQFAGIDGAGKSEAKKGKAAELPALLDKVAELDKAKHAADDEWGKKLREILGPENAAKVLLFLEQFEKEARPILEGEAGK